ncbi:MAG: transglycosylase domain-containing protein [Bacilli bacterium]|nr:transglycosylase domain-containing protein [Bacilli bacterium]
MKKLLKITKYLFIITLLIMVAFVSIFIIYSRKLDYKIPTILNVEVYDKHGDLFLTLNNDNKQNYVQIEDIDQKIIDAFISIEDKKFYKHAGIDIARIGGALLSNIEANSLSEGASTITQQYARNLYLSPNKNVRRKVEEIMIAINLETKYTKEEILEGYLNSIYFDHGIYGIEDACLFYFNKHAKEVSLIEAAALASIPKAPVHYSPINNPENNLKRRNLVIDELYKDNKITLDECNKAKEEKLKLHGKLERLKNANAPYFQDLILKELNELNVLKEAKSLKVYTSLDLKLNQISLDAINKYYPKDSTMQLAIYAMDPNTGEVLTSIGGTNYIESTFNRSTSALRQPGSAIKPFLYYAALENGFTPATTFTSTKTNFYINDKIYSPTNFLDIYPEREVSMAYAIAASDNIYAIKTHLFLGTDVLVNTLKDFDFKTPINDNVSLALGTSEVKLSELVQGYAKLASLGRDVNIKYINKIIDENNKTIYASKNKFDQKFNLENTYILNETMTNVFDNRLAINIQTTGAAIANKLTRTYAAKSGSTNTDNWMIGYNKDIVLGIWTGFDDNKYIDNNEAKYIKYIWAEIMEEYLKDRPSTWYVLPNNVIPISLNPISGMVAHTKEYKKDLYFRNDNLPWYIFEETTTKR